MIIDELNISPDEAQSLLEEHGSVRAAIEAVRKTRFYRQDNFAKLLPESIYRSACSA
jgi:hypothetical protein